MDALGSMTLHNTTLFQKRHILGCTWTQQGRETSQADTVTNKYPWVRVDPTKRKKKGGVASLSSESSEIGTSTGFAMESVPGA